MGMVNLEDNDEGMPLRHIESRSKTNDKKIMLIIPFAVYAFS